MGQKLGLVWFSFYNGEDKLARIMPQEVEILCTKPPLKGYPLNLVASWAHTRVETRSLSSEWNHTRNVSVINNWERLISLK